MLTQRDKNIFRFLESYKSISIQQAYKIFFNNAKYGYDRARKRLRELEKMGLLKSYKNNITREKVYYLEKKLSEHDLYINDFYSMLVFNGCKNITYIKNIEYLKGLIKPDAFFSFEYKNNLHFILLEVDLTHFTSYDKFQLYEKLYKDNIIQDKYYGIFPLIVVMGINLNKYESDNFETEYIDFSLNNFKQKILELQN